ncbi:MAG: TetR/AcrR family transcriptional regulator [Steroidobacteraceae bacterium]
MTWVAPGVAEVSEPRTLRSDARRNRERILHIAREIVIHEGSDVGMDVIAKAVGVGVGTLYRHFPTKQALMEQILGSLLAERIQAFEQAMQIEDPADSLKYAIERAAQITVTEMGIAAVYDGTQMKDACPQLQVELKAITERFVARIQRAGKLCRAIDASEFAALLCGMTRSILAGANADRAAQVLYDGLRQQI